MKILGTLVIPLSENTVEVLCKDLGKEDLVWDSEDSFFNCKKYATSDEAIAAGLDIPYHTGGPVESPLDNVPIWVTNEYLVSKETMEYYSERLKKINNIEEKEQAGI